MAKKSPEQLKEDDDRTPSMGLFNTAEANRLAAIKLGAASGVGRTRAQTCSIPLLPCNRALP
jgi:hypothetical protein